MALEKVRKVLGKIADVAVLPGLKVGSELTQDMQDEWAEDIGDAISEVIEEYIPSLAAKTDPEADDFIASRGQYILRKAIQRACDRQNGLIQD